MRPIKQALFAATVFFFVGSGVSTAQVQVARFMFPNLTVVSVDVPIPAYNCIANPINLAIHHINNITGLTQLDNVPVAAGQVHDIMPNSTDDRIITIATDQVGNTSIGTWYIWRTSFPVFSPLVNPIDPFKLRASTQVPIRSTLSTATQVAFFYWDNSYMASNSTPVNVNIGDSLINPPTSCPVGQSCYLACSYNGMAVIQQQFTYGGAFTSTCTITPAFNSLLSYSTGSVSITNPNVFIRMMAFSYYDLNNTLRHFYMLVPQGTLLWQLSAPTYIPNATEAPATGLNLFMYEYSYGSGDWFYLGCYDSVP